MNNTITVNMLFHFKGEEYNLTKEVKLPANLDNLQTFISSLPRVLAQDNGIDTYSYLFEMMECTDIYVTQATGFVSRFMPEEPVILETFIESCKQITLDDLLDFTLQTHLPDLVDNQQAKAALKEAFLIGQSAGKQA